VDDERERVAPPQGRVLYRLRRPRRFGGRSAPMHEVREPQARDQDRRGEEHQKKGRAVADDGLGDGRAPDGADRATDAHDGKEPLALLLGVRLSGEAPELRHRNGVENPDPQKERDAQCDTACPQSPKHPEVHREEQRHEGDECDAAHPLRKPSVETRHEDEEDRLTDRCVALHLGATAEQDERFARDLQQVVRGQEQEDVEGEQQNRRRLPRPDLPERAQKELHRMLAEAQVNSRRLVEGGHAAASLTKNFRESGCA
jgi:hypothetical protein